MFVLFSDTYIIVPLSYIKFGEYAGVLYCCNRWWYKRYGVVVSNCQLICPTVVLHWSSFPILLLEEEEGRDEVGLIRFRLLDILLLLHFVNPFS